MSRRGWPVALTVAGSDSCGGAGLQADLKTFAALEVYGAAAVTAVTSQNTLGVRGVHLIPPAMVGEQMLAVLEDLPVAAIKTGMLGDAPQLRAVAGILEQWRQIPLVVDPVLRATSGDTLLAGEAPAELAQRLLPLADLVTPNLQEARRLAGAPDLTADEVARELLRQGPAAVLITGGDGNHEMVEDLLVTATGERRFCRRRVTTTATHGTGCTLSAAVAAGFARGLATAAAVEFAVAFVQRALETAWPLGSGRGPVHHMHPWWRKES